MRRLRLIAVLTSPKEIAMLDATTAAGTRDEYLRSILDQDAMFATMTHIEYMRFCFEAYDPQTRKANA